MTEGTAGSTQATFSVSRTGDTTTTASVTYATANATATGGADYTALPLTSLTFAPGETAKSVAVSVVADAAFEPTETFSLALSSPVGAVLADGTGVATIVDDDAPVTLSVGDVSLAEGNGGTTAATFTVRRAGSATGPVTVKYATVNASAVAPADYTAAPLTTLSFAAGETTKTVTISVAGDVLPEGPETFSLKLSAPFGASLGDDTGVATIVNDDVMGFLSVSDQWVSEGDTGSTAATFTVTRTGNTSVPATVVYATGNGTAVAPADYTALPSTTLAFAAGETIKTVTVTVNGDVLAEGNETVFLRLSSPASATLSDATGAATIEDDDG
jgi:hypothetical protein